MSHVHAGSVTGLLARARQGRRGVAQAKEIAKTTLLRLNMVMTSLTEFLINEE